MQKRLSINDLNEEPATFPHHFQRPSTGFPVFVEVQYLGSQISTWMCWYRTREHRPLRALREGFCPNPQVHEKEQLHTIL